MLSKDVLEKGQWQVKNGAYYTYKSLLLNLRVIVDHECIWIIAKFMNRT